MKDNDSDETTIIMVMVNVVQSGQMLVKLTTVKNKGELIAGGGASWPCHVEKLWADSVEARGGLACLVGSE